MKNCVLMCIAFSLTFFLTKQTKASATCTENNLSLSQLRAVKQGLNLALNTRPSILRRQLSLIEHQAPRLCQYESNETEALIKVEVTVDEYKLMGAHVTTVDECYVAIQKDNYWEPVFISCNNLGIDQDL